MCSRSAEVNSVGLYWSGNIVAKTMNAWNAQASARERAMPVARQNPPVGISSDEAVAAIETFSARLAMPALSARPLSDRGSLLAQF